MRGVGGLVSVLAQRAASEALAWANGTSRRANGWAGEKAARNRAKATHPLKSNEERDLREVL
jgi:hypothetical protein